MSQSIRLLPPPGRVEVVIACALLVLFAASFCLMTAPTGARREAEFAVPPTLERFLPSTSANYDPASAAQGNLLLILFHRPDFARSLGDFGLGILIWLGPFTTLLIGRLHATRWGHPQSFIIGLSFGGFAISFLPDFLALLGCLIAVIVMGGAYVRGSGHFKRRGVFVVLCLFAFTAAMSSTTAHRLCATYRGLAPVIFLDDAHMLSLRDSVELRMSRLAPTSDETLSQIARLPGLGQLTYPSNLFARTRCATTTCVLAGLAYLIAFVITAGDDRRGVTADYMLIWPMSFYLALGAVFGLQFYAMYACEAARQNTLWIYARVLQGSPDDFLRLQREFERYGWSPRLEDDLTKLRRVATDSQGLGRMLQATFAAYWGSAVIAQDRPSVSPKTGNTELTLTPAATVLDMFYFSYASFTTTGYGDIRPVSDEARGWAIVENIAELLFTAVFFSIVVDWVKAHPVPDE